MGQDEENHHLSKKEMEKVESPHTMSYWLLMREFSQDVEGRNYDARYIYRLEDRICSWKQLVRESQTGSKKSIQMLGRETICIDSSWQEEYYSYT